MTERERFTVNHDRLTAYFTGDRERLPYYDEVYPSRSVDSLWSTLRYDAAAAGIIEGPDDVQVLVYAWEDVEDPGMVGVALRAKEGAGPLWWEVSAGFSDHLDFIDPDPDAWDDDDDDGGPSVDPEEGQLTLAGVFRAIEGGVVKIANDLLPIFRAAQTASEADQKAGGR